MNKFEASVTFIKISVGFVHQRFERNEDGQFLCTQQAFIAGDEVNYEDLRGNALTAVPIYRYEPLEMQPPSGKSQTYVFYNDLQGSLEPDRTIVASSREEALEQAFGEMGYSLVKESKQNQEQETDDEDEQK